MVVHFSGTEVQQPPVQCDPEGGEVGSKGNCGGEKQAGDNEQTQSLALCPGKQEAVENPNQVVIIRLWSCGWRPCLHISFTWGAWKPPLPGLLPRLIKSEPWGGSWASVFVYAPRSFQCVVTLESNCPERNWCPPTVGLGQQKGIFLLPL